MFAAAASWELMSFLCVAAGNISSTWFTGIHPASGIGRKAIQGSGSNTRQQWRAGARTAQQLISLLGCGLIGAISPFFSQGCSVGAQESSRGRADTAKVTGGRESQRRGPGAAALPLPPGRDAGRHHRALGADRGPRGRQI